MGEQREIGSLSVVPLLAVAGEGPAYLTGPEAFEAGLIEVSELDPPQVPSLAVFNLAEVPLLLVEGETLLGGSQNRRMNVTVLCPPKARTIVPVSCVEAGRWGVEQPVSRSASALACFAPGSEDGVPRAFGGCWPKAGVRTSDASGRRLQASR